MTLAKIARLWVASVLIAIRRKTDKLTYLMINVSALQIMMNSQIIQLAFVNYLYITK